MQRIPILWIPYYRRCEVGSFFWNSWTCNYSRKFSGLSHRKRIGRRSVFARSGELTRPSRFKSRFVVNWVFCQPVPPTSLTKRCDPGVEFSGNKLQTIHIIGLWKASALGMKEDEMVQKFKAEMTLVQEAHKEHGRKRSLTQVKADWHQAAKRLGSGVSRSLTGRMQQRFLEELEFQIHPERNTSSCSEAVAYKIDQRMFTCISLLHNVMS